MDSITIVAAGTGNIGSVRNMLRRLHCDATVTSDPACVRAARKLILPGVGAFDTGMNGLRERGLDEALRDAVLENGARLLGICLGMHLLLDTSEEGRTAGLGLVHGRARRFPESGGAIRVPHMGWNVVRPTRESVLLPVSPEEQRFYFVHSYFVECDDINDAVGVTMYGKEIVSVLERGRVMGVQFHPEKSHRFGMAMLQRYSEA